MASSSQQKQSQRQSPRQSQEPKQQFWQFWIDRGGTFTDIVAQTPAGDIVTHKLLSENPDHYNDAAVEGIRQVQARYPEITSNISAVKMGTTVATNALLERKGTPTVLMISKGLRDQLEIGYQTRPDIFALHIDIPKPLYERVYEAPERVLADGSIDYPLDEESVFVQLKEAYNQGLRCLAVTLMHAYRYPEHEKRIGQIARHIGYTQISLSHLVSPLIKLVPRGHTTVADAYLSPVLRQYVEQVASELSKQASVENNPVSLEFMQSNGGLTQAENFQGRDAILSGPAGGVVGMVRTAEADGFDRVVGFDMGGTSTDVSHYAGELERETETLVNGVRLRVPMMNIHTVAAGGGSIVRYADGRLQVGPESAGAHPGPACYRNGGPLTVTDCNLLLGRLQSAHFPAVFGPEQNQPLDQNTVTAQFSELAAQVSADTGQLWSAEQLAEGFLNIAVENMAAAVKKISVQRGYDIQDYILSAFGGAGGQHACAVAAVLGMGKVYLHSMAGVLSAYGIGIAEQRWVGEKALEVDLDQAELAIKNAHDSLRQQANISGVETLRVYLRYEGSDTPLLINWLTIDDAKQAFEQQHKQLFGFIHVAKRIWLDALQLEVVVGGAQLPEISAPVFDVQPASELQPAFELEQSPKETAQMCFNGEYIPVAVYDRAKLPSGFTATGPLLLTDKNSTHIIEPGWRCNVLSSGALLLKKEKESDKEKQHEQTAIENAVNTSPQSGPDPVTLEIFNNLFMSVAEQMGFVLEKTASSVNIKERLDFSCALFDRYGELVANAPHIPVHLGSMSESIHVVMRDHADMKPGDAFVLNTPYNGGTHLPDITVVKPVFISRDSISRDSISNKSDTADFYVAARGHHADIGGITPGSMPARSKHIDEEGVLLDNLVLMRAGEFQQDSILNVLKSAKYPARNPQQNIADLMAQLAACEKGASELQRLADTYGLDMLHAYMGHVQDNAEQTLRDCLADLPSGSFRYDMDDGSVFKVAITVDQVNKKAVVDFKGTGYRKDQPMHPGNFNAPTSVVRAAVLYSFRVLVNKPMPLNAGFFRALDIRVPEKSMIAPEYPAAVVSGNVETAQYLVDCLMGALNLMAGGQGTNNNFTFGNDTHQYYETLCGGAGASKFGHGASGVHTHMTNSRLTDPEILEQRFPVVLDLFHIRQLSGGKASVNAEGFSGGVDGGFNGGNGVERHIRFREAMQANIISGHRQVPTFALNGAGEGKTGVNFVLRHTGKIDWLESCADVEMQPGDTFCVHTPGGGGY